MPNYKSPDNTVHFLDSAEFENLLPAGAIAISDEEAEKLRPKPPELTYAELRAAEYPPATDLLDAIVKDDKAAIQAYKDKCLEIKAKYPK